MLATVLPGVRELRAPLLAGYLWLLTVWVVLGDELPRADEVSGPLARIYDLAPVVSSAGVLAAVSIAAYLIGTLIVGLQQRAAVRLVEQLGPFTQWSIPRHGSLAEAGRLALRPLAVELDGHLDERIGEDAMLEEVVSYVLRDRAILKTRVLSLDERLHAEIDRPDSEAAFRSAAWPPLAVLLVYLAVTDSPLWLLGLAVVFGLQRQAVGLRREANDAMAIAIAVRPELQGAIQGGVLRRKGDSITLTSRGE